MAKMRIYTVHIQPKKQQPYESPVFIEEAFNLYALVFGPLWAFYQRLWSVAIAILAYNAAVALLGYRLGLHPLSISTLQFGMQVFVAYHANDLRRHALKRRGYITSDIVTSDNLVGAEQRYFERYFPSRRLDVNAYVGTSSGRNGNGGSPATAS